MNSPFKIFRKHQKGVMVVMVFAALILFGIGDTLIKMVGGRGGPQGSKVVVETNIGKLTQLQMHNLLQQRKIVHRFVQMAFVRSFPELEKNNQLAAFFVNERVQQFGFGGISEPEVLGAWLYRHEARKLGIVVTDKQVEDYIDSFTNRKLTTKKFQEVLRDMQLGGKELFDILRDELQSQIAFRMKVPVVIPSPEKYWEYYQQLNTRQKIEVVALPVKDFSGNVPEPTDAQITKLFEQHKEDSERAFEGVYKPGFHQPRRVKLQYIELAFADIEAKARAAGPVTEKDIEEYYESRKAFDIRLQEGETGLNDDASPLDPGFAPENDEKMPKDEAEGDADSTSKPDSTNKEEKSGKPAEESTKPSGDEPKSKEPQPETKPEGVQPDEKSECSPGADDDAKQDAPDEADKSVAKPQADEETVKDKAGEKAPQDAKPSAKEPDDESAKEKEEPMEDDTSPKGPIFNPGPANPHEPPKIKFKPLDDDLREKIRESIIQERARKMTKDQVANAREEMSKVAAGFAVSTELKLTDPNPQELVELQRRAKVELSEIAGKFGMKYGETDLVSELELSEIPDLGTAQESGNSDSAHGESTSIIEQAFGSDALCRAFESETRANIYLCWKVADVAVHVPDLKEPGVREQVVAAWKRIEALPLAEKRAKDLAERARTKDKSFEEALSGETVTGDAKGSALAVAESKEFSFWRESTAPNPRSRQEPVQLDDPGVIKTPSREFMHVVFDKLNEGDVGVALNGDATIYYVVKVISRRPAEREAFKDVSLFAQNSPYAYLASDERSFVVMENNERIMEKYAIKWHNIPGRGQGQMMSDEE